MASIPVVFTQLLWIGTGIAGTKSRHTGIRHAAVARKAHTGTTVVYQGNTSDTLVGGTPLVPATAARGAGRVHPAGAGPTRPASVDALDEAPGIYSARWAGPGKDFAVAMRKVEDELKAAGAATPAARSAHFVCALCLAVPGEPTRVFTGKVHGHLVWPPRGAHGFGYDPVFQPDGHDITFGEMNPHDKHAMSHRAHAFAQLVEALSSPATPAQPE